jgi:hypothetical protein
MASTYSTNLHLELIGTGDQSGTWGLTTNNNLGTALEQAIVGKGSIIYATDADLTITIANSPTTTNTDARNLYLYVTSSTTLTATRNLQVPSANKTYIIANATTGGQSIAITTGSGSTVTVANGTKALVYTDTTVGVFQQFSDMVSGTTIGGATIADVASSQTLTNKTLTSPAINYATMTAPLISTILTTAFRTQNPLGASSIATTSGQPTIVITDTANGAVVGDYITLSNAVAVGGFTAANLNKTFVITAVTTNTVTVSVGSNASSTANGGGTPIAVYNHAATVPVATTSLIGTTDTATVTNKRISPRVTNNGTTYSGTLTPNGDTTDQFDVIGLTGATTISAPSGSPVDGQKFIVRIKDAGVRRTSTVPTSTGTYRTVTLSGGTSIATTSGSAVIVITDNGNGAVVGDSVTITNATAVGGITAPNLNQTFVISAVATNTITVTAGASATSTATGGGTPTLVYTHAGMSVTSGGNTVIITDNANGASNGDYVTISGVTSSIGGIPSANINGRFIISNAATNTITITTTATATFSATGGGGSGLSYDGLKITFPTSAGTYRAIGTTIPTSTTASKTIYVGCIYNNTDTYWDVVAVTTQA